MKTNQSMTLDEMRSKTDFKIMSSDRTDIDRIKISKNVTDPYQVEMSMEIKMEYDMQNIMNCIKTLRPSSGKNSKIHIHRRWTEEIYDDFLDETIKLNNSEFAGIINFSDLKHNEFALALILKQMQKGNHFIFPAKQGDEIQ